mmetsp:Transcript_3977/g.8512  ORF Transcript_3977/g.8512 Transcript_3977/m.8512 type:complete len:659 (-) Transcript_3977:296-2272(-)|eukprot:CAMPEP_0171501806 /NCGR_PEP_ID=MMETSP0958-20121227/9777_1 /TAXON_ID=87120 /ORGANISM="Aurantiochytrium limacinum, Strain ATCCMYA-1381" /LENGTH=658 /DNA_ID=CAMNT_0012036691 /DNA_START=129 /DNA_END=2105 /DNA_ORIENTATION=-
MSSNGKRGAGGAGSRAAKRKKAMDDDESSISSSSSGSDSSSGSESESESEVEFDGDKKGSKDDSDDEEDTKKATKSSSSKAGASSAARKSSSAKSEEEDDDEEEELEDGDKKDVSKMTELEREAYLFEKREKEEREKEIKALQKMKSKPKSKPAVSDSEDESIPSQSESESSDDMEDDDGSDYEEGRAKKSKKGGKRLTNNKAKRKSKTNVFGSEDEDDDDDDSMGSDDDSLGSYGGRRGGRRGGRGRGYGDEEESEADAQLRKTPVELPDVLSMQLTRSVLAKWALEPYFEQAVKNSFVRLYLGSSAHGRTYRLCQVIGVDDCAEYDVEQAKGVDKVLNLAFGSSSRNWKLDRISNGPITASEYELWMETMKEEKLWPRKAPSKRDAKDWAARTKDLVSNYQLTNEEVQRKIQKRKMRRLRTSKVVNFAAELTQLQRELELAKAEANADLVAEVERRILEVREIQRERNARVNKTFISTITVNARNAKLNRFAKGSAQARLVDETGAAIWNPFARKPTRPVNLWSTGGEEDGAAMAAKDSDALIDKAVDTANIQNPGANGGVNGGERSLADELGLRPGTQQGRSTNVDASTVHAQVSIDIDLSADSSSAPNSALHAGTSKKGLDIFGLARLPGVVSEKELRKTKLVLSFAEYTKVSQ